MTFKLTKTGADLVGAKEGDTITPSEQFKEWCAPDEKPFTIDTEQGVKSELDSHVFLNESHYTKIN